MFNVVFKTSYFYTAYLHVIKLLFIYVSAAMSGIRCITINFLSCHTHESLSIALPLYAGST